MLSAFQLNEIRDALIAFYGEYGVPLDGIYDDDACDEPCCNPRAATIGGFTRRLKDIIHPYNPEFVPWIGPSRIPSVRHLLEDLRSSSCEHVMAPSATPSMTTSGMRTRWTCLNCPRREYR